MRERGPQMHSCLLGKLAEKRRNKWDPKMRGSRSQEIKSVLQGKGKHILKPKRRSVRIDAA